MCRNHFVIYESLRGPRCESISPARTESLFCFIAAGPTPTHFCLAHPFNTVITWVLRFELLAEAARLNAPNWSGLVSRASSTLSAAATPAERSHGDSTRISCEGQSDRNFDVGNVESCFASSLHSTSTETNRLRSQPLVQFAGAR